ncbi:hypothetical protein BDP27DRAFT_1365568 [Rhodocollybia butyracea]|uniref:DUF6534 domain-containing protein n=1 Tax=Rhodocollybia butyracea TaxID=206335 RepID=A0A9P5PQ99_9AGAR|nr:hypothetical protein BDP27DRAFT_1365568 [Rhodocollybia butyracea]
MTASLDLDKTFGAAFIGASVAGFLLGRSCGLLLSKRDIHQLAVSVFQARVYFQENHDKCGVRTLVGMILFFDVAHQALIFHAVYWYVVKNYNNPDSLALVVCTQKHPGVSCFLNWRIWRLSAFNIWATGVVSLFIVGEFGCVIARVRTFEELALELKGLSIAINALAAAADVLISGILSFLLQRSKTGFRGSDSMLNALTLYAVNTGMLTSLCAVASLISIVTAPNTFIYIAFFFCMGRLYTNSLLATLNARKSIRDRGNNTHDNTHTTNTGNFPLSFRCMTKPTSLLSGSKRETRLGNSCLAEDEYELSLNPRAARVHLNSISLPPKAHIEVA